MAREYAKLSMSLLGDPGWRQLDPRAQHLYVTLLAHSELNYAGVTDWRPNRLMVLARDWTPRDFYLGAVDLADQGWIVIDDQTEEVLIRSFLRNDGILKQPRLAVTMTKAYAAVSSELLRACIVFELLRLQSDHPELGCWKDDRVKEILGHQAVNGKTISGQWDPPSGIDFGGSFTPGLWGDLPQTLTNVSGLPTTATATSTSTLNEQPASKLLRPVDNSEAVNQ